MTKRIIILAIMLCYAAFQTFMIVQYQAISEEQNKILRKYDEIKAKQNRIRLRYDRMIEARKRGPR